MFGDGFKLGAMEQVNLSEKWKTGVAWLNTFVDKKSNRESIDELFQDAFIEPLAISFDSFQRRLGEVIAPEAAEVVMNTMVNFELYPLEEFGSSKQVVETLQSLARKYGSRLRYAYTKWKINPLEDWFRINTEIVLRDYVNIHFLHHILKNDGTLVRFSSSVGSAFLLVDHIIRQITQAMNHLGIEAVLGTINPVKIEDLVKKVEAISEERKKLEKKIQEMRGVSTEEDAENIKEEEESE